MGRRGPACPGGALRAAASASGRVGCAPREQRGSLGAPVGHLHLLPPRGLGRVAPRGLVLRGRSPLGLRSVSPRRAAAPSGHWATSYPPLLGGGWRCSSRRCRARGGASGLSPAGRLVTTVPSRLLGRERRPRSGESPCGEGLSVNTSPCPHAPCEGLLLTDEADPPLSGSFPRRLCLRHEMPSRWE